MPTKLDISSKHPNFPFFYDVDGVVGYQGHNKPGDVMLVQFLLQVHYRNVGEKPLGVMVCDGKFLPLTHYWQLFFYHDIRADWVKEGKTWNTSEVGNVMSVRDPRASGGIGHTMIGQLNAMVQKFHPEIYNKMEMHPAVPAVLRHALCNSKAVAASI